MTSAKILLVATMNMLLKRSSGSKASGAGNLFGGLQNLCPSDVIWSLGNEYRSCLISFTKYLFISWADIRNNSVLALLSFTLTSLAIKLILSSGMSSTSVSLMISDIIDTYHLRLAVFS